MALANRETRLQPGTRDWIGEYATVRAFSERICAPLQTDDYQLQSIVETSPPKWHLAHVSWFFETFLLQPHLRGYRAFHPRFAYLFNSYYETVGSMHPRPQRGMLSRPTVDEVYAYRRHVDANMLRLLADAAHPARATILQRVELGLHHEQQHQELLFMDIKHNFSVNPLRPAYRDDLRAAGGAARPLRWEGFAGGIHAIGADGEGFCFDSETPRHEVLLRDFVLADRLVSNREYLEFMDDGGYDDPRLWLADGWALVRREGWSHPLYWEQAAAGWQEFTLGGLRTLDPGQPVCHLSFYEADAYARWAGRRLPSEAELEVALAQRPVTGNFADRDVLHPAAAGPGGQWFGDLWNWTASPYVAYPGFRPHAGSIGEYNGKFMANQMVLRGGCCATSPGHARVAYRNFFYPHDRWAFTGLRLAGEAA